MWRRSTAVVALFVGAVAASSAPPLCVDVRKPGHWKCEVNKICREVSEPQPGVKTHSTLESCRLACEDLAGVFPEPNADRYTLFNQEYREFNTRDLEIYFSAPNDDPSGIIKNLDDDIRTYLTRKCDQECVARTARLRVDTTVKSNNVELNPQTDESYTLKIENNGNGKRVMIEANTVWGARYGWATLKQLIAPIIKEDGSEGLVILNNAIIENDKPSLKHRGLMIDGMREPPRIEYFKNIVDNMSYLKLNVLHLVVPFDTKDTRNVYIWSFLDKLAKYGVSRGVRMDFEFEPFRLEERKMDECLVCYCLEKDFDEVPPTFCYFQEDGNHFSRKDTYKHLSNISTEFILHTDRDAARSDCYDWCAKSDTRQVANREAENSRCQCLTDYHKEANKFLVNTLDRKGKIIAWDPKSCGSVESDKFIVQTHKYSDSEIKKLMTDKYDVIGSDDWSLYRGIDDQGNTYYDWMKGLICVSRDGLYGREIINLELNVDNAVDRRNAWKVVAASAERYWKNPERWGADHFSSILESTYSKLPHKCFTDIVPHCPEEAFEPRVSHANDKYEL